MIENTARARNQVNTARSARQGFAGALGDTKEHGRGLRACVGRILQLLFQDRGDMKSF